MSTSLTYEIARAAEFEAAFVMHLELKSSAALYSIEPEKLATSRRHFLERYQVERAAADQGIPLTRIRADRKARRRKASSE